MNRLGSIHKQGRCDICGKHMNMGGFREPGTNLKYGHCCKDVIKTATAVLDWCVRKCGFRHPKPGELL